MADKPNIGKLNLPWNADRHPDPLCSVLYIKDSTGHEVCTFFGDFDESANAVRYVLECCNLSAPKAEGK